LGEKGGQQILDDQTSSSPLRIISGVWCGEVGSQSHQVGAQHRGYRHRPHRGGDEAMAMTDTQLRAKIRDLMRPAKW